MPDPFLQAARTQFDMQKDQIERAAAQLSEDQLLTRILPELNCVGVIMRHLAGSLRSRFTDFLDTDGEKTWRKRETEFSRDGLTRHALMQEWERGWGALFTTLDSLGPEDLTRTITIRTEPHTVALAIVRAINHCAYHTGQVLMLGRAIKHNDWDWLTIPPGESDRFNQEMLGRYGFGPDA